MTSIFDLDKLDPDDFGEKLDMDELYEKKKTYDMSKLSIYKKLLGRIHVRIKTTCRQSVDEQHCWYVVPEMIIGVPKFDHGSCIAYLLEKLQDNGFMAKYIHPNVMFISWKHWVPTYVRDEIKKRTGVVVDGSGEIVNKQSDAGGGGGGGMGGGMGGMGGTQDPNSFIVRSGKTMGGMSVLGGMGNKQGAAKSDPKHNYKSTNSYSPMGIYKDDLMRPFKK